MARQTVQKHMTLSPQVISSGHTLAQAHQVMRERKIRHLPVVDGGRLVGLVSQRDLYLLQTLRGLDPATETVEEAMSREPFAVRPDAPLDEVALAMAEHKYGSAVVVDQGVVVGLFTTVDALRALAALLRRGRRVS
ncbi:MAG TPA: CBS domain-containing protein [Anaeromyxobacteraceae bacterium]|nr:CBS domain-containing protein [Anaeromyxobacteraceae bacterium]